MTHPHMDTNVLFHNAFIDCTRLKIAADKAPTTTIAATQITAAADDTIEFLFHLKKLTDTGNLPGLLTLRRDWKANHATHIEWLTRRIEHAIIAAHAYTTATNDADFRTRLLTLVKKAGHSATELINHFQTPTDQKEAA